MKGFVVFSPSEAQKRAAFPPSPPSRDAQGKYLKGGYGNSWYAPWICHVKQGRGEVVVYTPCICVRRSQLLELTERANDKAEAPLGRYLDPALQDTVDPNQVSREAGYHWPQRRVFALPSEEQITDYITIISIDAAAFLQAVWFFSLAAGCWLLSRRSSWP